jgi:hypothetical protein
MEHVIIVDHETGYDLLRFESQELRDLYWEDYELSETSDHCKGVLEPKKVHRRQRRLPGKKDKTLIIQCERNQGTDICFCRQIAHKGLVDLTDIRVNPDAQRPSKEVEEPRALRISLD